MLYLVYVGFMWSPGVRCQAAPLSAPSLDKSTFRVCVSRGIPPDFPYRTQQHVSNSSGGDSLVYVGGRGVQDCLRAVRNGSLDLVGLSGFDVYLGVKKGLVPVMVQGKSYEEGFVYATVVVNASTCTTTPGLQGLRGLRSCHSSSQDAAGWWVPLGQVATHQFKKAHLSFKTPEVEILTDFFSETCAPGNSTDRKHMQKLEKGTLVCTGCADNCSASSPYYGDEGALRCILDGVGEVAFLGHRGLASAMNPGANGTRSLRLLCPQGGCAPPDHYQTCNLGKLPAWAMLAREGFNASIPPQSLRLALGELDAEVMGVLLGLENTDQEVEVAPVPPDVNTSTFMSPDLLRTYQMAEDALLLHVSFCNVGEREQAFCERVVRLLNQKDLGVHFWCVLQRTLQDCILAIAAGNATVRNMQMGEAYTAHKDHHLKVLMGERFNDGDVLYSVAIVRREYCDQQDVSFAGLRGRVLCSTGYMRPAGWHMAVGYMIAAGVMPVVSERGDIMDDAESVAAFFSKVCAPGARDNGPISTPDGYGKTGPVLCSACKGDCSTQDPYFTFKGAFRCLMEGVGDVAFSGHHTPLRFAADGLTPANWSKESKDKFRLLCPQGGCAGVDEYHQCHMGWVPGRALMVQAAYPYGDRLRSALLLASEDEDFRALVFNMSTNPDDLVLRAVAEALVEVDEDTLSYLGQGIERLRAMEVLRGSDKVVFKHMVPGPGPQLTTQQLTAVVICSVVIGVAVGVASYWGMSLLKKKRGSTQEAADVEAVRVSPVSAPVAARSGVSRDGVATSRKRRREGGRRWVAMPEVTVRWSETEQG